ncbi:MULTISPECIES: hypothetical protein [unclassified Methylobacterium]|uniref:hypothetical protein n=1 Tax=unclassified Methylobacterium TaxID=2615210 RepID=UPI000152DDB4|nr:MULTISPECIES: hypothetical protein [Methylobacterium]WFT77747.1 hypothetical protein QA634_20825 [Methylobacterium nodulans]
MSRPSRKQRTRAKKHRKDDRKAVPEGLIRPEEIETAAQRKALEPAERAAQIADPTFLEVQGRVA